MDTKCDLLFINKLKFQSLVNRKRNKRLHGVLLRENNQLSVTVW